MSNGALGLAWELPARPLCGSRNKISGQSNVLEDQGGNITKADGSMKIPVQGVTSMRKAVGIAQEHRSGPSGEGKNQNKQSETIKRGLLCDEGGVSAKVD